MQQEKQGGYLGAIVGYPEAHVRMAHLALPGSAHRLELFEYLEPRSAPRTTEPRDVGVTHVCLTVDDLPEPLRSPAGVRRLLVPEPAGGGGHRRQSRRLGPVPQGSRRHPRRAVPASASRVSMLREAASAPPSSLTIARIETVPIRVPLAPRRTAAAGTR